ncbi:hypothetical protein ACM9Z0_25075, partial [Escherichia coli]|uniref:hypothetical protein n=1 Tax=Escherichia coli TaxID=562 RepID=UPI003B9AEFF1
GPQNDVTLKMPAFEWVHVQLHQQKGMISLSPPTICNSALYFFLNGLSLVRLESAPPGGKIPVLLYLYTPFNFIVWIPRLISVTSLRVYRSVNCGAT